MTAVADRSCVDEKSRAANAQAVLVCAILVPLTVIPIAGSNFVLAAHAVFLVLWYPCLKSVKNEPGLGLLWLTASLWAAAQSLSSYLNEGDLSAAVGFIGLLVAVLVTMLVWANTIEKISAAVLCMSFAFGWIGLTQLGLGTPDAGDAWKYGLATPVAVLALSHLWRRGAGKAPVVAALSAFSIASLLADARFYALFGLLVVLLVVVRGRSNPVRSVGSRRLIVLSVAAATALYFAYPAAATSGLIGERAEQQQRALDQTGLNFVINNRAELFQGAYIVAHNPVLGTGAKVALEPGQVSQTLAWLDRTGVALNPAREAYLTGAVGGANQGYAPHSAMLDSAIQAGLLTFPFWLSALVLLVRGVLRYRGNDGGFALIAFIGGISVWNALFSPLDVTVYLGLAVALFLALLSTRSAA